MFGTQPLSKDPGDPGTVGVGVMAFYGTNDDRAQAEELHAAYLHNIEAFIGWLLDTGRKVRIFSGDAVDNPTVDRILADVRRRAARGDPGPA